MTDVGALHFDDLVVFLSLSLDLLLQCLDLGLQTVHLQLEVSLSLLRLWQLVLFLHVLDLLPQLCYVLIQFSRVLFQQIVLLVHIAHRLLLLIELVVFIDEFISL